MGMPTVSMIGPKTEQREQKEKKKEPIDYILEGLQVAQGITGIAVNYQTIKAKMGENATAEDARNGIQSSKYGTEYATDKQEVDVGTKGSVLLRTREKDDVIQEKAYISRPKEPGLRPPGSWLETTGPDGKPQKVYTENVVGASVPSYVKQEKPKSGAVPKASEGEKVVDREFAKEYNTWTSGAGQGARSEIIKLRGVADDLRSGKVETGGLTGIMPDRMTSKEILKVRADVESTVMNSLKAILGNAFTEKEGQRIIKATWNESDTTENNLSRIERLVSGLENQANAKDDKSMYFADRGTLNGWKPSQNKSSVAKDGSPKQNSGEAFAAPSDNVPAYDVKAIDAELKRRMQQSGGR